jgi:hypothetical protein
MSFQLTEFDRTLLDQITLELTTGKEQGTPIKFQFPPVVKSDNKSVDYKEHSMGNIEPIATFTGSGPRQISLAWVYVVTNGNSNGVKWTAREVAKQVKTLRNYYYSTNQKFYRGDGILVINFGAYDIVGVSGQASMSFRSDSVSISHSDTVVKSDDMYYSLKTDIEMKLKLWTKGQIEIDGKTKDVLTDVDWLKDVAALTPEWR